MSTSYGVHKESVNSSSKIVVSNKDDLCYERNVLVRVRRDELKQMGMNLYVAANDHIVKPQCTIIQKYGYSILFGGIALGFGILLLILYVATGYAREKEKAR